MNAGHRWAPPAGATLWLAIVAPPAIRHTLQSTMTLQMLGQLPLLALAGWLVARAIPRRVDAALAVWNAQGISGFVLAGVVSAVWMLPRVMDASLNDPRVAIAKFLSVPLLIGAPLALSWPRMGFVVRGVFVLESVATAFRLGWLYLTSPDRLCSNYLLGDQQRLGRSLVAIGVALCIVVMWKLMWGHIRVDEKTG